MVISESQVNALSTNNNTITGTGNLRVTGVADNSDLVDINDVAHANLVDINAVTATDATLNLTAAQLQAAVSTGDGQIDSIAAVGTGNISITDVTDGAGEIAALIANLATLDADGGNITAAATGPISLTQAQLASLSSLEAFNVTGTVTVTEVTDVTQLLADITAAGLTATTLDAEGAANTSLTVTAVQLDSLDSLSATDNGNLTLTEATVGTLKDDLAKLSVATRNTNVTLTVTGIDVFPGTLPGNINYTIEGGGTLNVSGDTTLGANTTFTVAEGTELTLSGDDLDNSIGGAGTLNVVGNDTVNIADINNNVTLSNGLTVVLNGASFVTGTVAQFVALHTTASESTGTVTFSTTGVTMTTLEGGVEGVSFTQFGGGAASVDFTDGAATLTQDELLALADAGIALTDADAITVTGVAAGDVLAVDGELAGTGAGADTIVVANGAEVTLTAEQLDGLNAKLTVANGESADLRVTNITDATGALTATDLVDTFDVSGLAHDQIAEITGFEMGDSIDTGIIGLAESQDGTFALNDGFVFWITSINGNTDTEIRYEVSDIYYEAATIILTGIALTNANFGVVNGVLTYEADG